MTATRSGPRVDRAARYGPWIFLIPFLVMTILCGQGVEEYVSDHSPGVPMQQATVRRCEGVHVNGMTTVCATTPDGTNVAFFGGRLVIGCGPQSSANSCHGCTGARQVL